MQGVLHAEQVHTDPQVEVLKYLSKGNNGKTVKILQVNAL